MRQQQNTPWGQSDSAEIISDGIIQYTTPSHGGIHVDEIAMRRMPLALAAITPFAGRIGWYEEDVDWSIVVLGFPHHFNPSTCRDALATAKHWLAKKFDFEAFLTSPAGVAVSTRAQQDDSPPPPQECDDPVAPVEP